MNVIGLRGSKTISVLVVAPRKRVSVIFSIRLFIAAQLLSPGASLSVFYPTAPVFGFGRAGGELAFQVFESGRLNQTRAEEGLGDDLGQSLVGRAGIGR